MCAFSSKPTILNNGKCLNLLYAASLLMRLLVLHKGVRKGGGWG